MIIGAVIITFGVVAYAGSQILKGNKEKHKSTSKQIKQMLNRKSLTDLNLVYQKRKPCTNCCKNYKPNMDFTWYEKYMNFQKEKN